jgi:hypothetical protein
MRPSIAIAHLVLVAAVQYAHLTGAAGPKVIMVGAGMSGTYIYLYLIIKR